MPAGADVGHSWRTSVSRWSEALVGIAVAALVFALPYLFSWVAGLAGFFSDFFVSDTKVTSALAFGIAAAGAMLSISRHQLATKVDARMREVDRLASLVDISNEVSHDELRDLLASINASPIPTSSA